MRSSSRTPCRPWRGPSTSARASWTTRSASCAFPWSPPLVTDLGTSTERVTMRKLKNVVQTLC
eukprot:1874189-Lingulodinium_polyedra.AAC.1